MNLQIEPMAQCQVKGVTTPPGCKGAGVASRFIFSWVWNYKFLELFFEGNIMKYQCMLLLPGYFKAQIWLSSRALGL